MLRSCVRFKLTTKRYDTLAWIDDCEKKDQLILYKLPINLDHELESVIEIDLEETILSRKHQ
jgi:hypothetical protein